MMARKDTRFPVRCPVAYASEDAAYQGMTFSLSRMGCAIESDEMASEGETVSLQIMEPGLSAAIRVSSEGSVGQPGVNLEWSFWSFLMTRKNG